MKPTLGPGLAHRFSYECPENKTVLSRLDQKAKSLAATS